MKRLYSLISALALIILLFSGCTGTASDIKQEPSVFLEAETQQDEEYFFSDTKESNITVNKANSASEESETEEQKTTEATAKAAAETTKAPETATTAAPETTAKPSAAAEKATAEAKKPSASKTTVTAGKKAEKETSGQAETTKKAETEKRSTTAKTVRQDNKSDMVWIPNSGARYHKSASCSGMKNPSHVSLSTAKARGYTPCKKCYG